jgi:diaminopimelate epimerase
MTINFHKYQGTGNDFIMIHDIPERFPDGDLKLIQKLCHRKFGIGADGLILIRKHPALDFDMIYFNSDGTQSLCGNGSRCAVVFAKSLGLSRDEAEFNTIHGMLKASILDGQVRLQMPDVREIKTMGDDQYIHTGSPHYIRYVSRLSDYNVFEEGKKIRYDEQFGARGTNVNFLEVLGKEEIFVRTYERGVEDETLSCGTGVTACAISYGIKTGSSRVSVKTPGGLLSVEFTRGDNGRVRNIFLTGPALKIFEGSITF